nr:SPOR domain-containing protein [Saprospiraceae bacterium]
MNIKFRLILTGVIVFFVSGGLNLATAQSAYELAAKKYGMGYYAEAAAELTKLSEAGELEIEGYLTLGKSLLRMNNPHSAEMFLSLGQSRDVAVAHPEFFYLLGQCLMMQGDYSMARTQFLAYAAHEPLIGRHYSKAASKAEQLKDREPDFRVFNMPWNTSGSEASISMFKGDLTLVSTADKAKKDCGSWKCNINGELLVTAKGDPYNIQVALRGELKKDQLLSMVSYCGNGSGVAFVKSATVPGIRPVDGKYTDLSIYLAGVNEEGDWDDIKSFPYNSAKYSNAFPFLDEEGMKLYFASNMPGGFGGFDLYISEFIDGQWSVPENLGPEINSPGDEISPFAVENTLFFSSDWHPGMGGHDVFYTSLTHPEKMVNAGRSINSARDDFNFILTDNLKDGFLVSNRPGGRGNEDVYGFSSPQPLIERTRGEIAAENTVGQTSSDLGVVMANSFMGKANAVFASDLVDPTEAHNKLKDVYSIQVASYREDFDEQNLAKKLKDIGDVYKVFFNTHIKVRVGSYEKRENAEGDLKKVREIGFSDAFVVREQVVLSSKSPKVKASNLQKKNEGFDREGNTTALELKRYLVRLGAFRNAGYFDRAPWKEHKVIEEKSGEFTVFYIGEFTRIEEVEKVRLKAVNNGYSDAFIVVQYDGTKKRY